MSFLAWVAAVAVLLGVLILVHELGHFVFAKLFDVKVLRFSLGFGPKLLGFTRGETEYRLSLVPLGGYVRLLGEDPSEPIAQIDRHRALAAKPLWQRYTVVIAGPAFNLLLPLLIYFFTTRASGRCCRPPSGRCCRVCRPPHAGPAARRQGRDASTAAASVTGRSWRSVIWTPPGKTLRFAIRRGSDAEERDVTPVQIQRANISAEGARRLIGVSPAVPPSRGRRARSGLAGGPGRAARRSTSSPRSTASRSGPGPSSRSAIERAGASPLRLNYVRGGYSAVAFAHIEIEEPGPAVVIPVAVFDSAGRRRYESGLLSAELFVFSVEPGSPADRDRPAPRRSDVAIDGQPLAHWDLLASAWRRRPVESYKITWRSTGGMSHEASFRQEVRSQLDAYRQEEHRLVFGARNRLAWKTGRAGAGEEPLRLRAGSLVVAHRSDHRRDERGLRARSCAGRCPLTALGGPLTIGYAAGVAAEQGFVSTCG